MKKISFLFSSLISTANAFTLNRLIEPYKYSNVFREIISNPDTAWLGSYAARSTVNTSTLDCNAKAVEWNYCANLRDKVTVPAMAVNNYMFRVDENAIDGPAVWAPQVRLLTEELTKEVHQCPFGMHQVLMKFSNTPLVVIISSISSEDSSNSAIVESNLSEQVLTSDSEFLFVPGNMSVSFRPEPIFERDRSYATADSLELRLQRGYACRFCVVDASNYQSVLQSARRAAADTPLGQTALVQLLAVDLTMDMKPRDSSLADLLQKHRKHDTVAPSIRFTSAEEYSRRKQSAHMPANTTVDDPAVVKGMNFKEWQESQQWNMLVTSLTLSVPSTPRIAAVGRNNVTILLGNNFSPAAQDQTLHGFMVDVCRIDEHNRAPLDIDHLPTADSNCWNVSTLYSAIHYFESAAGCENTRVTDQLCVFQLEEGKRGYTVPIGLGIEPAKRYLFRSRFLYHDRSSLPSLWSSAVNTEQLSTPAAIPSLSTVTELLIQHRRKINVSHHREENVTDLRHAVEASLMGDSAAEPWLTFPRTWDDGGVALQGYRVYGRSVECPKELSAYYNMTARCPSSFVTAAHGLYPYLPPGWQEYPHTLVDRTQLDEKILQAADNLLLARLGRVLPALDLLLARVHALPANTRFEFRVTPCNALGCGAPSEPSNAVLTHFSKIPTEHNTDLFRATNALEARKLSVVWSTTENEENLVVLNTVSQTLSLYPKDYLYGTKSSNSVMEVHKLLPRINEHNLKLFQQQTAEARPAIINGWRAHWGPDAAVVAPLGFNIDSLRGLIGVVHRGGEPLVYKILSVQIAGAVAAVVVDDGSCTAFDQSCLPGADKDKGEGFAAHDVGDLWIHVRIPLLFVLKNDFNALGLFDTAESSSEYTESVNHGQDSVPQFKNTKNSSKPQSSRKRFIGSGKILKSGP